MLQGLHSDSTKPAALHTIGKLAAEAGVTIDTVRFYEKQGLLAPAGKTDAGYRLYDGKAVRRLRFIKRLCNAFSVKVCRRGSSGWVNQGFMFK